MKKIVLIALLAGCAPVELTKPGVTQEEFSRDIGECKQQSAMATQGVRDGFERAIRQRDLTTDCMALRGYAAR